MRQPLVRLFPLSLLPLLTLYGVMAIAGDPEPSPKTREKSFSAGINITDTVAAEDTGIPVYPGATLLPDGEKDGKGANLSIFGGKYGMKLVVARLETRDKPAEVAAFYQKALTRFGAVLECRGASTTIAAESQEPPPERPNRRKGKQGDDPVSCDNDKPKKNGTLLKTGTENNQRIAAIETRGGLTRLTLIRLELRGGD